MNDSEVPGRGARPYALNEIPSASLAGANDGKDPSIEKAFTYAAPKPGQPEIYQRLRGKAKELAYDILVSCPASRERSLAITKLEEAIMWANAAIARN